MFYLQVYRKDDVYNLNFDYSVKNFLPQFVTFLKRCRIKVIDDNNIIELLISEKQYTNILIRISNRHIQSTLVYLFQKVTNRLNYLENIMLYKLSDST